MLVLFNSSRVEELQIQKNSQQAYATLIGDVVLSREEADQVGLLARMKKALEETNRVCTPVQPLTMTIGDEFQGVYGDLRQALKATLLVRLFLGVLPELRFGLGWGKISALDPERAPLGQSGPAWWGARAAIEHVKDLESRRRWPRALRTWVGDEEQEFAFLNAFLLCRDQVLHRMDAKDRAIALGLFLGKRQDELAEELGISQATISKRQTDRGASALFRAHEMLDRHHRNLDDLGQSDGRFFP
jgi:hypothetical protein